jgi:tyrosyl-tRNA synthetase
MTSTDRLSLITRSLQEVVGEEELKAMVESGEEIKCYWGSAPTGLIHCGYLCPMLKIADLIDAGFTMTILLADLHAFLDNGKSPMKLVKFRTTYYEHMIISLLEVLNVDVSKVKFVSGSSYQLSEPYMLDVFKMANETSVNEAANASTEDVKKTFKNTLSQYTDEINAMYELNTNSISRIIQQELAKDSDQINADNLTSQIQNILNENSNKLSQNVSTIFKNSNTDNVRVTSLLYPIMQALDEEYLNADCEIEGIDQRKISMFAKKHNPMLGYKKRIYLMNRMIPSIASEGDEKMSSSIANSKIEILDTPKNIRKKVSQAFCIEGDPKCNLMILVEKIMFPILLRLNRQFTINRPEKYGGSITYQNTEFNKLIDDFTNKTLYPADLKQGISDFLSDLFKPIRTKFEDPELVQLVANAYPSNNSSKKSSKN